MSPRMSPLRLRPAVPADDQAFERLFPELAVDDPMVSQERFDREDQPDVADALMAAGATLRLEIVHMKGPLPAASAALSADR
jgi:hypothetical protein